MAISGGCYRSVIAIFFPAAVSRRLFGYSAIRVLFNEMEDFLFVVSSLDEKADTV
jgi:hypothetical protein